MRKCLLVLVVALSLGFAPAPFRRPATPRPIELEEDVIEMQQRTFSIPIRIVLERVKDIHRLRLYFSDDKGATWKLHKEWKPTSSKGEIPFTAPRDGHFWFGIQVVSKDGADPADIKKVPPGQKLYVNANKRRVKYPAPRARGKFPTPPPR
jgi:hypothetical protein